MKYAVSILVPVYNVSRFIERCAQSLFEQTYTNIQYVFVDDCSHDHSITILNEVLLRFPERIEHVKIVKHEKNRGLAAARNSGIENADGKYVLHIDSDDYAERNMIEEMFLKAETEGADIVVADFYVQWKKSIKYIPQNFSADKAKYLEMLLDSSAMPAIWNKLIKRDLYIRHNIKTIEGVNIGEDLAVTPKLVYHAHRVVKLNKAFVHYVQYNGGSYTKRISEKNMRDIVEVLESLNRYFSKMPESKLFVNAIKLSKLKKKLEFLKQADSGLAKKIIEIFPENLTDNLSGKFTSFDRLLLNLSSRNMTSFRMIIFFYKNVFSIAQFLKGR